MRKKLLVVVAAFALVLCMPAMAFAANSAFDKGTAESTSYVDSYTGNAFLMERDALNLTVGRDLYWVGDTLNARGLEVGGGTGGSALLAGGTLNVASSTIHGSLRAAGQTVNVSSTTVGEQHHHCGPECVYRIRRFCVRCVCCWFECECIGNLPGCGFCCGNGEPGWLLCG